MGNPSELSLADWLAKARLDGKGGNRGGDHGYEVEGKTGVPCEGGPLRHSSFVDPLSDSCVNRAYSNLKDTREKRSASHPRRRLSWVALWVREIRSHSTQGRCGSFDDR
jgi:hypothetical protein